MSVSRSSGGLYCGQNVYNSWSTAGPHSEKGLAAAVEAWYNEVADFDLAGVNSYGSGSDSGVTGHYTQVSRRSKTHLESKCMDM